MPFVVLGVAPGRIEKTVASRVKAMEKRLKKCPTPESSAKRAEKVMQQIRAAPPGGRSAPSFPRLNLRSITRTLRSDQAMSICLSPTGG